MRALISLTDKTNVGKLANSLQELGYEIISTGGTYKEIEKSGVNVIDISKVTN
ncbi:MAG: bifunctional phosphoribosylaminoimidazolecarboxamide formyltransferase/IMP cyclohydrolase, partial [Finegoldia magna]|nr:bifunctional phosphoribosylaminoimidazolecarboxamide formyltransferase/IMP cyclohydrolase [Finegoldia magna]